MRRDPIPNYSISSNALTNGSPLVTSLPLQNSLNSFIPIYCEDGSEYSLKYANTSNLSNEVDQTFDGTSSKAQSGEAILNAIKVLNPDYANQDKKLSLGYGAKSNENSINIGYNNHSQYTSSNNDYPYDGIVIGYNNYPTNSDAVTLSEKNIILGYDNDISEAQNATLIGSNNHVSNRYNSSNTILIGNYSSAATDNEIIVLGNHIDAGSIEGGNTDKIDLVFSNGYSYNNKYHQFYFGLNNSYNPILGVMTYNSNGETINDECYVLDLSAIGTITNEYPNLKYKKL